MPKFINLLHGRTSHFINKLENSEGRNTGHNYWDHIIRNKTDFWTKFNYIHYNPVKHGIVNDPGAWKHSTYKYFLVKNGSEWMADCFESYPVIEYDFEQ